MCDWGIVHIHTLCCLWEDWDFLRVVLNGMVRGIVLMNLVTAVIVQGALDQALQDQELQQAIELGRRKKLAKAVVSTDSAAVTRTFPLDPQIGSCEQ
eukprot:4114415-Amphidinium_carterae.1